MGDCSRTTGVATLVRFLFYLGGGASSQMTSGDICGNYYIPLKVIKFAADTSSVLPASPSTTATHPADVLYRRKV